MQVQHLHHWKPPHIKCPVSTQDPRCQQQAHTHSTTVLCPATMITNHLSLHTPAGGALYSCHQSREQWGIKTTSRSVAARHMWRLQACILARHSKGQPAQKHTRHAAAAGRCLQRYCYMCCCQMLHASHQPADADWRHAPCCWYVCIFKSSRVAQ